MVIVLFYNVSFVVVLFDIILILQRYELSFNWQWISRDF